SDYIFDFRAWEFQHEYPTLWSEYEVEIPEYYDYVFLAQGYKSYHINTSKDGSRTYRIHRRRSEGLGSTNDDIVLTGMAKMKRWVMKDVPALKAESFVTTMENYRSKIEFQLSAVRYPNQPVQMVMESWPKVTENLMKSEAFGDAMQKAEGSLDEPLKPLMLTAKDPVQKARLIFEYIRDNFTWNGYRGIYTSGSIKNLIKTKTGSVADINLLLTATLKSMGFTAYPVILSTRDLGYTHELYPLMDRFNYVICAVLIGEEDYLLDASDPDLGFGRLPNKCYNGHARVLTADPLPIDLAADSLLEKKVTLATIVASPVEIKGNVQSNLGYFGSSYYRNIVRQKGQDALFN
ncbi:transglutaminase domain-containing protein, partial [Flavihumibacter sp. CACIAM 22H1]|uniref:transglutaminase domain-containing protein n=1 Tax=Flavihumibacter sp. CACIAM 22H1 TaxID=1812911 RepID=UPI003450AC4B